MKKSNIIRSLVIAFVLLSSMSSYLYLNCCAADSLAEMRIELKAEEMEQGIEEESIQLPDLTIIERTMDIIKVVLPSN